MSKKKGATGIAPRTKAEWVSLFISIALLAVVVGIVIALWLRQPHEPARFRVERGEIRNEENHYYLSITVTNEGDTTGAQVTVEGKLKGASSEETSATTFDFIPAHSSAEGVLVFKTDAALADVRVVSYQKP